jgi:hydroxylamine reductase (hybrid-cluster protein)
MSVKFQAGLCGITYVTMRRVNARADVVKDYILHSHHQIHQLQQLTRRVISELAGSDILDIIRRQPDSRARGIAMEMNTI